MTAVRDIRDVAEKHLCCGCGACAYVDPARIRMVDDLDRGRRPVVTGPPDATRDALAVCPGWELAHEERARAGEIAELRDAWGPVLEVWEGYASDPEIRYLGSSGGAATALSLHCIEREGMHGVLHIAARPDVRWLNRTVLSRTRAELVAATGSRYAPASPCDGLAQVEAAPAPCVFIGKPCDVAATSKARRLRPALDEKLGLTIGIFCAGTPSTRGTLEMIRQMGFEDPSAVESVRYRGKGWPGMAEAVGASGAERVERRLTYDQSWGKILQKHRQWRCYVCLDHTGEFADVSVGDPWYRPIPPDEPGRSLVVVRTERGRAILARAIAAGALTLERVAPEILPASQPNLLGTRGAVWGRALVCRIAGGGAPRYRNMAAFRTWWRALSPRKKLQSILGTAKRVLAKKLYARRPVVPFEPVSQDAVPPAAETARARAGSTP